MLAAVHTWLWKAGKFVCDKTLVIAKLGEVGGEREVMTMNMAVKTTMTTINETPVMM